MFPPDNNRRTLWLVRFGGIAFAAASTYVFFFGLGGAHSHGQLWMEGEDGRTAVPSLADDARAPATLSGGEFRFAFDRAGGAGHDLVVTKAGENEIVGRAVTGGSDSHDGSPIRLSPGSYTIICVLPGHASDGMTYRVEIN